MKKNITPVPSIKPIVFILAYAFTSNVWSADEPTVVEVDNKATAASNKADNANSKADGNNGRIQALEQQVIVINETIEGAVGPQGEQGPQGLPGKDGIDGQPIITFTTGTQVDDTDDGIIPSRDHVFYKEYEDTTIRLTYYDNHRVNGNSARWTILVDGVETNIVAEYHNEQSYIYRPATIIGYLHDLSAGDHLIQVQVGKLPGTTILSDAYTGWDQTQFVVETNEFYPR